MRETMKKLAGICKTVFGYGIVICLFAGGLTFFGYMAALIIGGETAELICHFIYKVFIPKLVYATSCLVILGLVSMYLAGETALTVKK